MHAFDARLRQLLDAVPDLTAGRRQRLARSLRQDDVELGMPLDDSTFGPPMKAALRVAAHEILDTFCLHLEGALARCGTPEVRSLVLAIVALSLAGRACVLFDDGNRLVGLEFRAAETIVIGPGDGPDEINVGRRDAQRESTCRALIRASSSPFAPRKDVLSRSERRQLVLDANEIAADPFRCAASLLERLRAT